eukprot:TRINITY_DN8426_c0_g1_i1.p1 TRINITY_DN8426_c0_g1~~TRINITY_DN8426_c0_g1_i1.p1  ORF type:complete len:136 (+),score=24.52 TRINITY_DN8426_c0_g1_i1:97-504(+)
MEVMHSSMDTSEASFYPKPIKRNRSREDEERVHTCTEQIKRMRIPELDMDVDQDPLVQIKVATLSGKVIEVQIKLSDTILVIKEMVETTEGIPPEQQRLVWQGKTMSDERTAASYGLRDQSLIHIVLALRGGGST